MKRTSFKTMLFLLLLIGSSCLLVWAGTRNQFDGVSAYENLAPGDAKPWDSLSVKEQQLVHSYWNSLRNTGSSSAQQLRVIASSKSLAESSTDKILSVDTTIITNTADWMLFQSADVEMIYTHTFNSILDKVQESVLLLPPTPTLEKGKQLPNQLDAIKPEDYFISILVNDSLCTIKLVNPEHINLTSIELTGERSSGKIIQYSLVNPNYSAEGGTPVRHDVQIEETPLTAAIESELLSKLWVQFSQQSNPKIKPAYTQFSVTNLLQP